jgi:hypothetical protein
MSISSLYSYILSNIEDLSNEQISVLLDLIQFNFLLNHLELKFPKISRDSLANILSSEYKISNNSIPYNLSLP